MMRREAWDLRAELLARITKQGGWTNCHTHLDRAYTITLHSLPLADAQLQAKWQLVDEIKRKSSVAQIYDRMAFSIERQLSQGVTAIGSFIDVDDVITDKAIKAAQRIQNRYGDSLSIKFINQTLKGVLDPKAKKWFDLAVEFVDIIGGLPGKDHGREDEHLDVLFTAAKRYNKLVHVHVDQFNTARETETELLVKKVKQYNMDGSVTAIHGVSIAAQKKQYRKRLYANMKKHGVSLITCPTAWIDSRRTEEVAPSHNAIAPVEELVAAGVTVGLGTDNIADIYKPFTDGDMWIELRFLLESCHYYELDQLVKIATTNGRKILGISKS